MRCPKCGKRKIQGKVITETPVDIINGQPYQNPESKSQIIGLKLECICGKSWNARKSSIRKVTK